MRKLSKRIQKKWALGVGATLFFLVVGISVCVYFDKNVLNFTSDRMLTKAQVIEDREQAIQYVEDVHPFFLLEKNQEKYEAAKHKYIERTQKKMTVDEFWGSTSAYLCSMEDAHTRIGWRANEKLEVLRMESVYRDGKTYLLEDGRKTDAWIEEIDGIDIEKIYEKIEEILPAENEIAEIKNRDTYTRVRKILEACDVGVDRNKVEVSFSDGRKRNYFFGVNKSSPEANSWYMDNGIFVVDFNTCVDDDNLKKIAEELENSLENGCTKVIIDVRGNSGGDSAACDRLVRAMGMEVPDYGIVARHSEEAAEQFGYQQKKGISTRKETVETAKQNNKVNLVVLSDRDTFSSATMLCVYVRDGKLGTIIGEPSSNKPNSYGDILMFELKNSRLPMSVSYKRFIRPDSSNKENMLMPDIQTSAIDAYKEAVKFFLRL